MHELRPTSKDRRVRGNNTVALRNAVEPLLYLLGFLRILLPGNLDSSLYFTDGHCGNVKRLLGRGLNPGNDALVRFALEQLRDNIRVEEIHGSVDRLRCPALQVPSCWEAQSTSSLRGEQQRLQSRAGSLVQATPLLHRYQYRCLDTPQRYDLRPFRKTRFQKLAEAGFRILNRPRLHLDLCYN